MYDFHAAVPKVELQNRLLALRESLTKNNADWKLAIVQNKINLYYFTGTMQDGVLTITPDEAILWVRRSIDRAKKESLFEEIRPMRSYRTLGEHFENVPKTIYLEKKHITLDLLSMMKKYLCFEEMNDLTPFISKIRMEKSDYEIACMKKAGEIHKQSIEDVLPNILREGVSEAELCGEVYLDLLRRGSMGICRYNQSIGEDVGGFCAFGENTLETLAFDGPDGCKGSCIAVQSIGSPMRKLKKGELVMMDLCAGVHGYHTDKTAVYYFGNLKDDVNADKIKRAYEVCMKIEKMAAEMLKPDAIPEEIYFKALDMVPDEFKSGFMSGRPFLGHSIGLTMDEAPVLAKGFTMPITDRMLFAVEPKIALEGIGIVGTENTYLVTQNGGVSLTGSILPLTEIK